MDDNRSNSTELGIAVLMVDHLRMGCNFWCGCIPSGPARNRIPPLVMHEIGALLTLSGWIRDKRPGLPTHSTIAMARLNATAFILATQAWLDPSIFQYLKLPSDFSFNLLKYRFLHEPWADFRNFLKGSPLAHADARVELDDDALEQVAKLLWATKILN